MWWPWPSIKEPSCAVNVVLGNTHPGLWSKITGRTKAIREAKAIEQHESWEKVFGLQD